MKGRLIFAFALLVACSSDKRGPGPSPLETAAGFCGEWALAACNEEVVDACSASSAEDCQESQAEYCLSLIPEAGYRPNFALECLDAVRVAYEDADLDSSELRTVRQLAAPCDRLVFGSSDEGDACETDLDCNTLEGFACVFKLGNDEGECQVPREVGGGRDCSAPEAVCELDFYCDGDNCIERRGESEACEDDAECAAELRCASAPQGAGGAGGMAGAGAGGMAGAGGAPATEGATCQPRIEATEPCAEDSDCETGICGKALAQDEGLCASRIRLSGAEPICRDLR